MAICGLSLHSGITESRKTLEQRLIFQTSSLNSTGINEPLVEKRLFIPLIYSCFSRFYVPTNHVAPFFVFKSTHNPQFPYLLRRRATARNVSFYNRNGDQFTISTLLIYSNYSR